MLLKLFRKSSGVSLIDIVLSIVILYIVALFTFTTISQLHRMQNKSHNELIALSYAQQKIEEFENPSGVITPQLSWTLIPGTQYFMKIEQQTQESFPAPAPTTYLYRVRLSVFGPCRDISQITDLTQKRALLGIGSAEVVITTLIAKGYFN